VVPRHGLDRHFDPQMLVHSRSGCDVALGYHKMNGDFFQLRRPVGGPRPNPSVSVSRHCLTFVRLIHFPVSPSVLR